MRVQAAMKSLMTLVGCLAFMALLAACGGGGAATPTPTTPASTSATPTPTAAQPATTPTSSFDAAAYFGGKTIHIVANDKAGGGTDVTARAVATVWGQFIPGHPNIVVENKTPSVAGLNYVWLAKPDGLTVGSMATSQMYTGPFTQGAQYNAKGWGMIGSVLQASDAWSVSKDVPYQTLADAEHGTYPIKYGVGSTDPGQLSTEDIQIMWLADQLDIPLQVYGIVGLPSTSVLLVAFEKGDINIIANGNTGWIELPAERPDWLSSGYVRPFVNAGTPGESLPPVPGVGPWPAKNVVDYLSASQKQTWLGLLAEPSFNKPFFVPPNTPAPVLNTLRTAFWQMLQDPTAAAAIQKSLGSTKALFKPEQGADDEKEIQQNADTIVSTYEKVATTQQRQAWVNKFVK